MAVRRSHRVSDPLSVSNLEWVEKELRQVGAAAALVGAHRNKLGELAGYVEEIADAFVGTRPDVATMQGDLRRAAHNARRARGGRAWRAIKAMETQVKEARRLLRRGLGDVPISWEVGDLDVVNVWGYTEMESKPLRSVLNDVAIELRGVGLDFEGRVYLDPSRSKGSMLTYLSREEAYAANPEKYQGGREEALAAFAGRLWLEDFDNAKRKTWGSGRRAFTDFRDAFIRRMTGKPVDRDAEARLRVTVGRIAGPRKWARDAA